MGMCTADAMALIGPRWCSIIVAILYNSLIQFLNESIFISLRFRGGKFGRAPPLLYPRSSFKRFCATCVSVHNPINFVIQCTCESIHVYRYNLPFSSQQLSDLHDFDAASQILYFFSICWALFLTDFLASGRRIIPSD